MYYQIVLFIGQNRIVGTSGGSILDSILGNLLGRIPWIYTLYKNYVCKNKSTFLNSICWAGKEKKFSP